MGCWLVKSRKQRQLAVIDRWNHDTQAVADLRNLATDCRPMWPAGNAWIVVDDKGVGYVSGDQAVVALNIPGAEHPRD